MLPLLGLLAYQLEFQARHTELNGKLYPLSHRVVNRGGTVVQVLGWRDPAGLDRKAEPRAGAPRMSAHAMVQEYLNLADELYGLVTNGRVLRLLRDSSRLIKLSYLEFDLERIFGDGLFADFALLYRLLHASRLPARREEAAQCWLERYHLDSLDAGSRIRAGLSQAVEQALKGLANGFIQHPANAALRERLRGGALGADALYQQLLRLIYRLLFLMVIEERGLVFPPGVEAQRREIYERYYSLQRLRRLSEKRHLADRRHADLWPSLLSTFELFEAGGPGAKLGLAPLAGELFGRGAIANLAGCALGNDALLGALRALNLYAHPDSGQLIRVNYGALNVEEFGAVYEGLLEYEPAILWEGEQAAFDFRRGDERANTGSHYTPDELVQPLLKHSLDHLIAERLKAPDPVAALLDLRVADVACGSGHILLAAARRIATELAIHETREDQPSPSAFRAALRRVICNCIYGVDLNPLAVELCKVALWLEAHVPGEPLSFLDHHVKCGNAIVGSGRREDIGRRGVPDEAFKTLPGDDKETAAALRKRNKAERAGQGSLGFDPEGERRMVAELEGWRALDAMPDHTPEQVEAKRMRFIELSHSPQAQLMKQLASLPIAQFYVPKRAGRLDLHVTEEAFRHYWQGSRRPEGVAVEEALAVAERKRFFHWFLEFPEVMARGGFDCVVGNPPYLGGQDLSGTYGYPFCNYVKWEYVPAGLSDLVVYFVRRIFGLLRQDGFMALLATNSIKDGDVRKDGLEQVIRLGGCINLAVRGVKWPGRANMVVSMLAVCNGEAVVPRVLDGQPVCQINAFLEEGEKEEQPSNLLFNAEQLFQGSIFLGDGFVLGDKEVQAFVDADKRNVDVIFPLLNGQELNNEPLQQSERKIINFFDWSAEAAARYKEPFQRIEQLVRPMRAKNNRVAYREKWWLYGEPRPKLMSKLSGLDNCFLVAANTKYLNFSRVQTGVVFTHTIFVLTTDRWDLYAVVQSTLHEIWARKYSGTLKQDLRYSPSKCFETFPFPSKLWDASSAELAAIGERYHEHRRRLMRELWLGLTDVYNLFHAKALTPALVEKISRKPADIAQAGYENLLELRRLHLALDAAVRDAYGWQDLDLSHDFVEVETLPENDRVRFTISPAARRELLRRLLVLNHERAEAEKRSPAPKTKPGHKKSREGQADCQSTTLFGEY
ncbi:type IIL restriction-modification enzyme MmeI [uncultured Azohydromonas sp.]|uniref:Eco57I restriction-modification methylase domain-containing protein n=1 Tax=uncultured Azohydromonas sp. TaxID=487342 RepID=UPI0026163CD2|nr:type IIL restriction-modification enzyme MmeI [uncultured Azohydromonas sp.]